MTPITPSNEPTVFMQDGNVFANSRDVAEGFEKRHADVMRSLVTLGTPRDFDERNFAWVEYKDAKGETRRSVNMTRDGFTILAMGFTGKKAMSFKLRYIEAFNRMEAELNRQQPALPTNFAEALRLAADEAEQRQLAQEEVKRLAPYEVTAKVMGSGKRPIMDAAGKMPGLKDRMEASVHATETPDTMR